MRTEIHGETFQRQRIPLTDCPCKKECLNLFAQAKRGVKEEGFIDLVVRVVAVWKKMGAVKNAIIAQKIA